MYIKRIAEETIKKQIKLFPAVALTGPRQSGKSTLLKHLFNKSYQYVTFDDPLQIEFFESDPQGFMQNYADKTIFDEVQRVPALFNYLKIAIDNNRQNYGNFILTGSSQFSMIKQITETLAGRIGMLNLLPFQLKETPDKQKNDQILLGSYPELICRNYSGSAEWYAAYIRNYLERDVRNLANIGNLRDFQRLISLLAARTSQELNMSSLSKELGISVKTVQSWISILEASYIIFLVPSYHKNLGKRIVKRPKVYFYDTGLVCYLTGIRSIEMLDKGPLAGPIFENFVTADVKKRIAHLQEDAALFYFRDNLGLEVDLIIENYTKNNISLFEIKKTHTIRPKMFDAIKSLSQKIQADPTETKTVENAIIYSGKSQNYSDSSQCINYREFLGS
ncbi:MAG: ATP-binding protein [Candidatus Margulisiibacteriota bacterium]